MAHVVNLIVQAILTELNDPEQDDYYIPNKHITFHYNPIYYQSTVDPLLPQSF